MLFLLPDASFFFSFIAREKEFACDEKDMTKNDYDNVETNTLTHPDRYDRCRQKDQVFL